MSAITKGFAMLNNLLLFMLLVLAAPWTLAQGGARQDGAALRKLAQTFLQEQSAGLPGQVKITVGAVDTRLALPACPAPQAFQQPGARPWGKTTVGVRCTAPLWTVFVQAQVSVFADYVTASVALPQGKAIEASQLALMQGDIAALPNGIITDLAQAVGRVPTVSLQAGALLRLDALKSMPVVQQNQAVRIVSRGENFSVSGEGKAIGNASEGQVVQVRTQRGAIVSGTARAGGVVEVSL
jgi:flagella basal body P-ring formation protein FlgA